MIDSKLRGTDQMQVSIQAARRRQHSLFVARERLNEGLVSSYLTSTEVIIEHDMADQSAHAKNPSSHAGDPTRSSGHLAALAYALRGIVRYTAYTSDVGEAFRPVVHVNMVRAAYAASWGYVIGDVAYDTYDKKTRHGLGTADLWHTGTKRVVFQSIASMALPAFTIHSLVHYSKSHIFKPHFPHYVKWGPTCCGLAVVPALPFMYDYPIEVACDWFWFRFVPLSDRARAILLAEHAAHAAGHHHAPEGTQSKVDKALGDHH